MNRSHRVGIVIGIVATALVGILVGVVVVFSGTYDISATTPHTRLVRRTIATVTDRSIRKRASGIELDAPESADLLEGIEHYEEMCAVCHTSPGTERTEIAQGLYPRPPHLTHEQDEWSDAELFWIVKNGIKMTGMPAFGPTHSDEVIRDIVAVVRRLPSMSAEQYDALLEKAEAEGHGHDEDAPPSEHEH